MVGRSTEPFTAPRFRPATRNGLDAEARNDSAGRRWRATPVRIVGQKDGVMRGTVLVVDDEPTVRALVAERLEAEGYRTRRAADGLAALDLLAEDGIDLIVADVQMPCLDGPSLVRRMRHLGHSLPVVLVSGGVRRSGRDGSPFASKPFDADHLVATVGRIMDSRA